MNPDPTTPAPEGEAKSVILRHPHCRIHGCNICYEDHIALDEEFNRRCGTKNLDHLRTYRVFWEKATGRIAETETGWAVPEVFDEEKIANYVFEQTGELQ